MSRCIGPLPQAKPGVTGWLILAAISGALLLWLVAHPVGMAVTIGVRTLLSVVMERQRSTRVLAIVRERADEDIGSFARAFDRRGGAPLDPWAIGAVWNALVPLTEAKGRAIPLRPKDRFEEDLGIDPDDVENLVPYLVEQCERVPANWAANPFNTRLAVVADLVYLISAQPLRRST